MKQPNLLFLMTDQQRADTTTAESDCYMPNLQRLAAEGSRFNRCYTVNPICSPSRASLMTGVLPHTHGMVDCTHAVPAYRAQYDHSLPVWPRLLHQAGYYTGYFGKWHVDRSNRLETFGFDEYEVGRYHQVLGLVEREEQMSPVCRVSQPGYRDFILYGVVDTPVEQTAEFELYSRGIEFLNKAARNPDRPWALFLSTEAPHDPYVVPRAYYNQYNPDNIHPPPSFYDDLSDKPYIYHRLQKVWQTLTWKEFAQATACYYAFCTLVDTQIGRIIQLLHELNLRENTIIVFTSDHGDYLGSHRLMLKGVPAFEEAYHIPLILNGPGIPAGQQIDQIVSLLDLPKTLVELTTGDAFSSQGRSLVPLLLGTGSNWQNEAFAECHGQRFYYTQRILWQDNFKYVFNGFDQDELYHLESDPYEQQNLAQKPESRPMLTQMAGRMWQIIRDTGDDNMLEAQYGMFRFAPVGPEEVD